MHRRVTSLEDAIARERSAYLADRWRRPGTLGCNATRSSRASERNSLRVGTDDAHRARVRAAIEAQRAVTRAIRAAADADRVD